jgi:hypothetical protein
MTVNRERPPRATLQPMPAIADTILPAAALETAAPAEIDAPLSSTFRFVPRELAIKCRQLIESYHAIYGYVGLPDMLWLSDARDIIESHRDLMRVFTKASKARGAKRANASFLLIATTIVSLEVLARDFSGWGKRFPAAQREAEKVLGELSQLRRTWLMDLYLFPPLGVRREFTDALGLIPTSTQS